MSCTPLSSPKSVRPATASHLARLSGLSTPGMPAMPLEPLLPSAMFHSAWWATGSLCTMRTSRDTDRPDETCTPLSSTPRTELHRLRERGRSDRGSLDDVLEAGLVCHLGVVIDGVPVVLPTGYGRIGRTLYLHGSSANRSLRAADGHEVCVTVTHLDGLVCARAAFAHSVNYRSAVVFGTARIVTDEAERL